MTVADGLEVSLAAAEPLVRQPVAIDVDDRGRLWVLQYLQYPNPAGLKRIKVDRYSRTTYDRVPKPPPHGPRGADRLTILSDVDGDGRADKSLDFIEGLNLATGFAFANDGVYVLQTPYLLFYPDRDRDDHPDGDPQVLLSGFGMEDSSSLANSLTWGPDGWLYGTQGTNLTANIRGVPFEQGMWRYHPRTKKFELFAEGGANMWGLDFDADGNLLAGTNYGGYLMLHGVQGAYYQKSFAKHGELHNPFAFGFFEHVPHKNFQGGHVTVGGFVYQGESLSPEYRDKYIAVDTLHHAVRWHHLHSNGSTLRSENGGVLLQANDNWFAPSDAVMGPDGSIYVADWCDKRTAHPDPDANWDRSNGRIYRIQKKAYRSASHVDPNSLSSQELVAWLGSRNEWRVRRARRVITQRGDATVAEELRRNLENSDQQLVRQSMWLLHALDSLDERLAINLLERPDAHLRAWVIRLICDDNQLSAEAFQRLLQLARTEASPVVVSQLASSCQRMTAAQSLSLIEILSRRPEFNSDPHIPLLIWWALEHHALENVEKALAVVCSPQAWAESFVREQLCGRLLRRLAAAGEAGYEACARIIDSAPDVAQRKRLYAELDAGLAMLGRQRPQGLPPGNSFANIAVKRIERPKSGRLPATPASLKHVVEQLRGAPHDALSIRLAIRLGDRTALKLAIRSATDPRTLEPTRLLMLAILHELGEAADCVDPILPLVGPDQSPALQVAAVELLGRFSEPRVAGHLMSRYASLGQKQRARIRSVMLSRPDSALALLREADRGAVDRQEISLDELRTVALHNEPRADALVRKHWGKIGAGTAEEKLAEIRRINNDLRAGSGVAARGRLLFQKHCASCHQLFGEGKKLGPDLTQANRRDLEFLLASIVDPSAQIRKEFLSYVVETDDGRVLTGLVAAEDAGGVSLVNAKNELTKLRRDEIVSMQASPLSLMPEDLLRKLRPQELRDLTRYLQQKK